MSEFNDNKQPRRRRTQLNAAQYAGQQTLDNSIPLIRTEDAPMQPTNPPRRNPQPPPAQQSANPPMQPMGVAQPMSAAQPMRPQGMNQPGQGSQYAQSGQMHGFRGVQGTPMHRGRAGTTACSRSMRRTNWSSSRGDRTRQA